MKELRTKRITGRFIPVEQKWREVSASGRHSQLKAAARVLSVRQQNQDEGEREKIRA